MMACAPPVAPPAAVPDGPVAWSYIAVGDDGSQVRARGFDGAAPAGAQVEALVDGQSVASVEVDARGRFDVRFDAEQRVTLQVSDGGLDEPLALDFAVRDMEAARARAVNQRLAQTGSVPNTIALAEAFSSSTDALLLLVNSGDNSVDNLALSGRGRVFNPLLLPATAGPVGPVPAQPHGLAVLGELALVTRLGHSGVTLFDIATGVARAHVDEANAYLLPTPFAPAMPVDGDGDGSAESLVTALWPRTYQAVAFRGGRVFVCAANLLRASAPTIFGPGMVMVYDWSPSSLARATTPVLWTTAINPQFVTVHEERLAVVETGALELGADGWIAASDGGVDLFDAVSLAPLGFVPLGRTAPGSAAVSVDGRYLYVGSLLRPELYKIELATATLLRGPADPITLFESSTVQTVFAVVAHPSGLLLASSFNSDQVFVVDTLDDTVSPWPFEAAFRTGEAGQAFGGAQALTLRAGRNGVHFRGPDVAVLMGLAARVATLDTRHVLGP